jgi:hypothetical protein
MKIKIWTVIRKWKKLKKFLWLLWELYYLVRVYLPVLKKEPRFEELMAEIYAAKVEIFGEYRK